MNNDYVIRNAQVVLPDQVMAGADVWVRSGRIAAIAPRLHVPQSTHEMDATGLHLLPGMIDLHTDSLEKEICPRTGANFPIEVALLEFDRKLAGCGITTVYHSLHYGYQSENTHQMPCDSETLIRATKDYGRRASLTRTRFHLRYETAGTHDTENPEGVRALLNEGLVDLMSFMDHTPGQGQYPTDRFVASRMKQGRTEDEARALMARRQALPKIADETLQELADLARSGGIVIASHDDCSAAKVRRMYDMGIRISEFPVNVEAAREAKALGMYTLGGSPNSLRGGSLSGNMDVNAALTAGLIDGLCSDYYPPSMLHATIKLWRDGYLELAQAVQLTTRIPAQILGQDDQLGSLQVGLAADLLLVDLHERVPRLLATFVNGNCVSQATDLRARFASPRQELQAA